MEIPTYCYECRPLGLNVYKDEWYERFVRQSLTYKCRRSGFGHCNRKKNKIGLLTNSHTILCEAESVMFVSCKLNVALALLRKIAYKNFKSVCCLFYRNHSLKMFRATGVSSLLKFGATRFLLTVELSNWLGEIRTT